MGDQRDSELLAALDGDALPSGHFGHEDHVRLAWAYLRRGDGLLASMARFTSSIRRIVRAAGQEEKYHETITCAFLVLIDQRIHAGSETCWERFRAANPDLLEWKDSILKRYYTDATLWSGEARRRFVLPDRSLFSSRPPNPGS